MRPTSDATRTHDVLRGLRTISGCGGWVTGEWGRARVIGRALLSNHWALVTVRQFNARGASRRLLVGYLLADLEALPGAFGRVSWGGNLLPTVPSSVG